MFKFLKKFFLFGSTKKFDRKLKNDEKCLILILIFVTVLCFFILLSKLPSNRTEIRSDNIWNLKLATEINQQVDGIQINVSKFVPQVKPPVRLELRKETVKNVYLT